MSKKIFISHSVADQKLVDAFVDLLQTGADISTKDIFCSSLEGMGIPVGQNFIEFIKNQLENPDVVIVFLTKNYLNSQFCQCELGASWILSSYILPIIVEPLTYEDVKAVLTGIQSIRIKEKKELSAFITVLNEKIGNSGFDLSRWEVKRDVFLRKLGGILSKLPCPQIVEKKKYDDLEAQYESALKEIENNEKEIQRLNDLIETIKDAKGSEGVEKAILASLPENKQYESLLDNVKSCLNKNKPVVNYALYERICGNDVYINNYSEQKELADDADGAVKDGFLIRNENTFSLDESDPQISSSLSVINELKEFMSNMSEELNSILTEKYGFVPGIENRRFWEDVLRQGIRRY